jgi:uncharacterized protein YbjT (DUF2867 family)
MILVTGSGGKTGRAVIRALLKQGASVRGIEILESRAQGIRELGAEAYIGDMNNVEDLTRAADGVDAIYHICPNVHPNEIELGETVIAAALKAGVPRFVFHSLCHSQIEALPNHWYKLRVEEKIKESGLNFTILQPTPYMQNVLGQWDNVLNHSFYEIPYKPSTLLGMVDLGDIAEVASLVLTTPKTYDWATYELAGPEVLSQDDIVATISRVIGKEVRLQEISRPDWGKRALAGGMSEYNVEALLKMFAFMESNGFWGNPGVLEWLLGRKARRFEEWVTSIYKFGSDK